jgi:acetyl-CoA decarbonylase/synthase complex subunit alpha
MIVKKGKFIIEDLENVQINIGKIVGADEELEVRGLTPSPEIHDLRDWDKRLLGRYEPVYSPVCDLCCYCTYGKCDLTGNKEGACGINMETHQAREILIRTLTGAAAHTGHGRHLLHYLIERFGADHPIDVGPSVIKSPNTQTVMGIDPQTIGDYIPVLDYVEEQITQLLATVHAGQEGSALDYDSKALHAGMLDHVGMEVSDNIQISCLGFPKSDEDSPLVDIGMGLIDSDKPVLLCIGHNVAAVTHIIDYVEENNLMDKIEVVGLCCTALDMTRYNQNAKIVGSMAKQLKYIRSGIPDVIVVDEQCIRGDVLQEASKLNIPVIATNNKIMYNLPDRSNDDLETIMEDLVSGAQPGVLLFDFDKIGELAPRLAVKMAPIRKEKGITALPDDAQFKELTSKCSHCRACVISCPQGLPIDEAMAAAAGGDLTQFEVLHDKCIGCGRCESDCPESIPVLDIIEKAARKVIREEKGKVRAGRGQVSDPEIREEGRNLVLGTTPGIVAIIGCPNYPDGSRDIYDIAEEMLNRSYIVVTTGCSAMDIGMFKDQEGKTLYERFKGRFVKGNLLNIGSCVSNAHITATAIKVASIFAGREISGNYEEIADYVLNRIGAVGLAWGAFSQKALSIGTGCNRLGIPTVLGPHGAKYRRAFIGKPYDPEKWNVLDARDGSVHKIEPAPEHLFISAETKEEVMPMLAKLCFRPSDNNLGRMIKLTHYIELSEKYLGALPDDWHVYVRSEADLPLAKKEMLLKLLEEEHGWKINWDKKKILEGPFRKPDVSFQPTNIPRLCKGGSL